MNYFRPDILRVMRHFTSSLAVMQIAAKMEQAQVTSQLCEDTEYIPVAIKIPADQLANLPAGHDLLIKVRHNAIHSARRIAENDEIPQTDLGEDVVIRVKKSSTTDQPAICQLYQPRASQKISSGSKQESGYFSRLKRLSLVSGQLLESENKDDRGQGQGYGRIGRRQSRFSNQSFVSDNDKQLVDRVKKISTDFNEYAQICEKQFRNSQKKSEAVESRMRKRSALNRPNLSSLDTVTSIASDSSYDENNSTEEPSSTLDMFESEENEYGTTNMPQVLAALGANLGAFSFGTVLAWSSTGTASLNATKDFGELTGTNISWIGAIAILGAVCACPFAGYAMVKYGRRKVMLYLTGPFLIGWLLIAMARDIWHVYVGRFLTGFCGGCFSIAVPIFTSETTDPDIRGGLGAFFDIFLSLGMLYIYTIGQFFTWRTQAALCGLSPLMFHCIMFFMPESPRYLMEKQKHAKAEKAIYWLKGVQAAPSIVKYELSELSKSVGELQGKEFSISDTFQRPVVKPTLIMVGLMLFTSFSGVDAVFAYTVAIFETAGAAIDSGLSTIIIGIVSVCSCIPAALVVDHFGRRLLLMISGAGMTISLSGLGVYFYVKNVGVDFVTAEHLGWLPLASLICFIITYSFGYAPLHILMIGEVLPNNMKGLTSCIVLSARWGSAFLVTMTFDKLNEIMDDYGTFFMLAGICLIGVSYVYCLIPETKGKTVDEIQIYFLKK